MREAGVELIYDASRASAIGVVQAARLIAPLLAVKAAAIRRLERERPGFVLAVDFGAFNLRLTPSARQMGLPVAYWFPPGSWRRTPPAEHIVQAADFFISPYPWYAESLTQAGARAAFLGHPFLDQVKPRLSREEFMRRMGLPEHSRLVALLPGSRGHEVDHNLPVMVDAAAQLAAEVPGLSFVVAISDHYPAAAAADLVARCLRGQRARGALSLALARAATQEALCHASVAAVCSGSATLEALVAGAPMVVVYRGSKMMQFEYKVRRMNIKYMAMPNILMDAPVVPELRQEEATAEAIAVHLRDLLGGPARSAQMEALSSLRALLEPSGAIDRTADALLDWYAEVRGTAASLGGRP